MIIDKSRCPRSFRKKTEAEIGFDYHSTKMTWMSKERFFGLHSRLDSYIGRLSGRKILFSPKHLSAFGKKEDLPNLRNFRIIFLPSNTASKVQHLDAGIIVWVKAKYQKPLLFRVFKTSNPI